MHFVASVIYYLQGLSFIVIGKLKWPYCHIHVDR